MEMPAEDLFFMLFVFVLATVCLLLLRKTYFSAFKNYFNFKGKCSRKDFFGFILTNISILLCLSSLITVFDGHSHLSEISNVSVVLFAVYFLATSIPVLSIVIRRYHDVGEKWYWLFVPWLNVQFLFFQGKSSNVGFEVGGTVSHRTEVPKKEHKTIRNTDSFKTVFISYSSEDDIIAIQTKKILEENGINCWMAPQSIPAGGDYASEIPVAIERCSVFVLLLSKASQESHWVPKEVGLAVSKNKIIIPFQIDNNDITASFNFFLTNNQRILAYSRMAEAYMDLVKRVKDIIGN